MPPDKDEIRTTEDPELLAAALQPLFDSMVLEWRPVARTDFLPYAAGREES